MDGMNKITLGNIILSGILTLAVVVLFVMHFTGDTDPEVEKPGKTTTSFSQPDNGLSIAFVNSDLILERYDLVKKLAGQLERESRKKDADLQARQKEFETEAAYFQESMQKQSLSEKRAQGIYEQLMAKQEEIYQIQQQYSAELAQQEFEMNMTLLDSVRNYLERLNVKAQYDYILNYNASGSILQARGNYDITEDVLQGLNSEYQAKYGGPREK
jgi:outer membrane protein